MKATVNRGQWWSSRAERERERGTRGRGGVGVAVTATEIRALTGTAQQQLTRRSLVGLHLGALSLSVLLPRGDSRRRRLSPAFTSQATPSPPPFFFVFSSFPSLSSLFCLRRSVIPSSEWQRESVSELPTGIFSSGGWPPLLLSSVCSSSLSFSLLFISSFRCRPFLPLPRAVPSQCWPVRGLRPLVGFSFPSGRS